MGLRWDAAWKDTQGRHGSRGRVRLPHRKLGDVNAHQWMASVTQPESSPAIPSRYKRTGAAWKDTRCRWGAGMRGTRAAPDSPPSRVWVKPVSSPAAGSLVALTDRHNLRP